MSDEDTIPFLIFKPGQQQREDVYVPTSCVDLLPTLLHLNGQAVPDWCEGEVLHELVHYFGYKGLEASTSCTICTTIPKK